MRLEREAGGLEILHDNPDLSPEEHEQFSGIIIKESERLSRLIGDVLNFQKIESASLSDPGQGSDD